MNYLPLLLFRGVALYCPERQAPNIVCHSHDRWPCAEAQAVMENTSLARLCSKSTSDMTFINVLHENLFSSNILGFFLVRRKMLEVGSSYCIVTEWHLLRFMPSQAFWPLVSCKKVDGSEAPFQRCLVCRREEHRNTEQLFSCFLFLGRRDNMSAIINLCHLRNGLKKEVWQWKTLVGIESTGTICNP